jgi:hypothetical protein
MARRTVPSPPQTKNSSAPSSSARSICSAVGLAFGTSYQSGSSTPARSRTRRSSAKPLPNVLDALATTATFMPRCAPWAGPGGAASVRGACGVRRAGGEQQHDHGAGAHEQTAALVERMVHAAVHAGEAHEQRDEDRHEPGGDLGAAAGEARCEQDHEARVDRERGGHVAGDRASEPRSDLHPTRVSETFDRSPSIRASPGSGCTTCGTATRHSRSPRASTPMSSRSASGTRRWPSRSTATTTSCRPCRRTRPLPLPALSGSTDTPRLQSVCTQARESAANPLLERESVRCGHDH